MIGRAVVVVLVACLVGCRAPTARLATPREVIESKADLWGDAALKQRGGPSYEFFEKLLPPIRYVDADFRHYPIVLSAPGSPVKARLVSNGSAINALARQPNWKNEDGIPTHILVGAERETFGQDLSRLDGPRPVDGYLPIYRLSYREYGLEAFASVDPRLSAAGAVLVKFDFHSPDRQRVELRFESGYAFLTGDGGVIKDRGGKVLAAFDDNWEYNGFRSSLTTKPQHRSSAVAMILTQPTNEALVAKAMPAPASQSATRSAAVQLDLGIYNKQRDYCVRRWNDMLAGGMNVVVPEPVVNNAWRSMVIGTHAILLGDQLNYSASNQYARQYANECGNSMRSMLLWGHRDVARRSITPLFTYRRPGIELHDGAFKLELLADYYFITRDRAFIDEIKPLWQREVYLLLSARQATGMFPRERYCSDIDTPILSLNNNANAWRGLRDMSVILSDRHLAATAAEYRKLILAEMDKAVVRSVDPPFVPVALSGEEPPPNPITSTRLGSYWNLVIPDVLWSGVFPIDSAPADAIINYIQRNGGLCMGMTRVQSNRSFWINPQNIDDLYNVKYALALLRRDEPDRALVGFYGKIAQGMTRDTFIDGESTGIIPLDRFGRQVALPPNSAANASFLLQLRNLLVQDWDTDDDAEPDTLRLLFATPRRWLEDGKRIEVQRAATAFGELSLSAESDLRQRRVVVNIDLPSRPPKTAMFRVRLPAGYRIVSNNLDRPMTDRETLDLTGLTGRVELDVRVAKQR
jgi:hypothetical protein